MSNPYDPANPQGDRPGDQPNYDAYRYPSGGSEQQPAAGQQPGYGAYGSYDAAGTTPGAPGFQPGYAGGADSTWALSEEKNGVAPWALGIGVLALIMGLSIIASGFAFIAGAIGIIVGAVALLRGRNINGPGRRTGMSVAGIVLSAIAVALSVLFWVMVTVFMSQTGMSECISLTDPDEQRACVERSLDEWMNS